MLPPSALIRTYAITQKWNVYTQNFDYEVIKHKNHRQEEKTWFGFIFPQTVLSCTVFRKQLGYIVTHSFPHGIFGWLRTLQNNG